ncbi:MAG: PH domain-containing protein [Candidatus Izemoplasma sp.]
MKYYSKVDKMVFIIFIVIEIYLVFLFGLFIYEGLYIMLPLPILIFSMMIHVSKTTYYQFKDEYLLLRSGIFFVRIRYERIKRIYKKKQFPSGFALSKDQVHIRLTNKGYILGTYLTSPLKRDEFYEELQKRCYFLGK